MTRATLIEIEGIWRDGSSVRFAQPWPGCSTGVAQSRLRGSRTETRKVRSPWLTRVYHDGVLVREFDSELDRYTLCLDSTEEHLVPKRIPVPEPTPLHGGVVELGKENPTVSYPYRSPMVRRRKTRRPK